MREPSAATEHMADASGTVDARGPANTLASTLALHPLNSCWKWGKSLVKTKVFSHALLVTNNCFTREVYL